MDTITLIYRENSYAALQKWSWHRQLQCQEQQCENRKEKKVSGKKKTGSQESQEILLSETILEVQCLRFFSPKKKKCFKNWDSTEEQSDIVEGSD